MDEDGSCMAVAGHAPVLVRRDDGGINPSFVIGTARGVGTRAAIR